MTSDSFAAAQERVLARRAARQAENQARQQAQEAAIRHSALSRLPLGLNRAASPLHNLWSILQNSEGTRPAFRVGQVDAELLDEELLELLKTQVGDALKYYGPHLRDEWSQEILLALRAALFKLSIWDNDASYGASLQNLKYADARKSGAALAKPTRWQKGFYGLFTVVGRYGWDKWEGWLAEQEGGYVAPSARVQLLSRLTTLASTTHSIAALASFLVFLVNGRYRTLTDRILRLRLASPVSQVNREVSFEYLNRQLVWHAFTEFLLFLLPLVGITRWRKWLGRVWKKAKSALRSSAQNEEDISEKTKSGVLHFLPERTCPICYEDQNPASTEAELLGANTSAGGGVIGSATTDVVNPYETILCGCIYCFVCIATKLEGEEGSGWTCLRCGEVVYKCRPWNGDVLVERRTRTSSKNVGFANEAKLELAQAPGDKEQDVSQDEGQWSMLETTEDDAELTAQEARPMDD
jgi:peroxin-2